ncbi:uncharacterized protein At2g29880-like [Tasmannia lanceolata]|uniref:uncharacterized protein At2g29880-like n=1 Tax=Tasmannia lanceolata TaxID=3420 RepID=UPI00406447B5
MSKPTKAKATYEQWSAQESRELLRILVDEANNGARQTDGSFSKNHITTKVLPMLNSKLQCNKTYDHVRSKLRVWKRTYKPIAELMASNSGFGWDPFSKKIIAPEEVWDTYIAVSEAGINIGNEGDEFVDVTLDDDIGNGGDAFADDVPSHMPPSHSTSSSMQQKRRYEGVTPSRQRVRPGTDLNERLVESFTDLVREMKDLNPKNATHANWLKAPNEIPNLERNLRYRAPEFLNTPEFKEQFIDMDVEAQRDFLLWKCENRS